MILKFRGQKSDIPLKKAQAKLGTGKSHHKSSLHATNGDMDEPLGGLSDNDDAVERATLNQDAKAYFGGVTEKATKVCPQSHQDMALSLTCLPHQVRPIAAVVVKTESATRTTEGSRAPKSKKDEITIRDLPATFQNGFRSRFVPMLRQFTGTLGPWDNPEDHNIRGLWCIAFPTYLSQIPDGLFLIISKLVRYIWAAFLITYIV